MMVRKQMKKSKEQLKYKVEYKFSYLDMKTKSRVCLGEENLDIYDTANLLNSKHERIAELESVLKLVHEELLMRSEEDSNGYKVVQISSSVWNLLKETLKIGKGK
jgi:hypothetical protein